MKLDLLRETWRNIALDSNILSQHYDILAACQNRYTRNTRRFVFFKTVTIG